MVHQYFLAPKLSSYTYFRPMGHYWLWVIIFTVFFPARLSFAAHHPPIQLASRYQQGLDVTQYWVSEKLDGVRAYWDGTRLISRRGHVFAAPDWFIEKFPKVALDGELWMGRGQFDRVSGIVRQQRRDNPLWQQVKFMVFDLPRSTAVFSQRIGALQQLTLAVDSIYLQPIEQRRIDTEQQLLTWLDEVVANGGEGLMLHRGQAYYQAKRSSDLLKLKKYQDAEATVLAHLPGKGKFSGMLGALQVKTDDGVIFKIGSGFSNLQRQSPPPIGCRVTYKFYGKTGNKVPRFASFIRIRQP